MSKTNAELMKELKEIQRLISYATAKERRTSVAYYSEQDKHIANRSYNYEEARNEIYDLQKEELRIRNLLAISNATTIVSGYDLTIASALVRLGQLTKTKFTLQQMANKEVLSREISYGKIMYEELNYDLSVVQKDLASVTAEISNLQMALDLTNLTNIIES